MFSDRFPPQPQPQQLLSPPPTPAQSPTPTQSPQSPQPPESAFSDEELELEYESYVVRNMCNEIVLNIVQDVVWLFEITEHHGL